VFITLAGLGGPLTFVVPAGFTAVARDLDVYYGASDIQGNVRFQDVDSGGTIWYGESMEEAAGYLSWRGRQVFPEGHTMQVSTADVLMDVRLCGYLLTNP